MGKFLVGLIMGGALGAGISFVMSRKEELGEEGDVVGMLQQGIHRAVEEAKQVSLQRERELWREFYTRVPQADKPGHE